MIYLRGTGGSFRLQNEGTHSVHGVRRNVEDLVAQDQLLDRGDSRGAGRRVACEALRLRRGGARSVGAGGRSWR